MAVKLKDYTKEASEKLDSITTAWLYEAMSSVAAQASRNSPVDTGALKTSFQTDSQVDEKEKIAYVGSTLEYSIWQEFGTGEYALQGNGRKGGWTYKSDKDGNFYHTRGSKPNRMLYKAFQEKRDGIENRLKEMLGEM